MELTHRSPIAMPSARRLAVALAAALMLVMSTFFSADAGAASSLGLSAGSSKSSRVTATVGQKVTLRARWQGAKRLPADARIVLRYAKASAAGAKKKKKPALVSLRRTCARGAASCAWPGEVSRVAGSRAYQAVVVRKGRVVSRSRTVTVRWQRRAAAQPTPAQQPAQPVSTAAPAGTPATVLANKPPVALAGGSPLSGLAPLTVTFSSSGTHDPDGSISGYAWDLDGDGQFDDSTAANPSFVYTSWGSFRARLRVTDDKGAQAVSGRISIASLSVGGSGELGFESPASIATGPETHSVAAHDLDGDGDNDLVAAVASANVIAVSRNNGSGAFGAAATYGTGALPNHVAIGDVDGDGRPDLVSTNENGNSISVLRGNGDGTFVAGVTYPTCQGPHEAALGDLNGDGKQDVAVACFGGTGDKLSILLNSGNTAGSLAAKVDYTTSVGGHSLVLRDFDRDGDLDIAEAAFAADEVAVLRNNDGKGTFGAATTYPFASPHHIASSDLNGDGRYDLVVTSEYGDAVGIMLGNAGGTFDAPDEYIVGDAPKATSIADLDGDGILDLATVNSHGNYPSGSTPTTLTILRGDGDGSFSTGITRAAPLTPFSIAIADLDGDGRNDLATANWHSDDVKVYRHS